MSSERSDSDERRPCGFFHGDPLPEETWRDEMYGDENGTDPFWVPLEASDGHDRDPIEAANLVKGFIGPESFDTGLSVELVRGRMEDMGPDGWFFHKDVTGDVVCWEVCCS